jgi:hypothetical protein
LIDSSDDENSLREKFAEIAAIELLNLLKNDPIKELKAVQQSEEISSYYGEPIIKIERSCLNEKRPNKFYRTASRFKRIG